MRKSRFKEEQIIATLREHEAGAATGELCRRLGGSEQTLYRGKRKNGGGGGEGGGGGRGDVGGSRWQDTGPESFRCSLREPEGSRRGTAGAAAAAGGPAATVRVQAAPRAVAQGGDKSEPQAAVPALSGRGARRAPTRAQEGSQRGQASGRRPPGPQPALEPRLRERRARLGTAHTAALHHRHLHPGGVGHRGGHVTAGDACGAGTGPPRDEARSPSTNPN